MTPIASDESLLDGLSAGSRDAFARLYAEHHAAIYNLCARVLCDREEAKDVTQEVFITAFDHFQAADAEPVRKLRPWLYRVATNACFNQLRARKRLDGGGDAQLQNTAAAVDEFERAETVALVERSLGEMNERYRTALVLKDLQGLPADEIAEVMEVSRPTADVLVHRARASFKTVFAKLAGSDAAAPAALGLVLLPLSVPAALQAMPPLPAHLAPLHAPPHAGIASAAGPAGAGLLTKIGAAVTTKTAIAAAAAAVVIGGGVVALREVDSSHHHPASVSTGLSAPHAGAATHYISLGTRPPHAARWARHGVPIGTCDAAACLDSASGAHHAGEHSSGSGDHAATHDAQDTTASSAHDAGMSSSGSGDHAVSSGGSSDHAASSTSSHDGGDMASGHDGSDN